MTFIEPPAPIVEPSEQEARIRSAVSKYTRPSDPTFRQEFDAASPQAQRALRTLDAERLSRGGRVLPQTSSAVGLRAATTGESVIGNPDEGLWGDFTRNVGEFTSGLPRLPQALVGEVLDVRDLPDQIPEALQRGDSPIEDLGNLANLPGLRMIPGSYVAGQFGTDGAGVKGLVDNPLFTALDVLPFASKAAGATRTVRLAESLAEPGARVGKFGALAKYGRPGGPVTDTAGKLVPNALGQRAAKTADRLGQTKVGNAMRATWGRRAGDIGQESSRLIAERVDTRIADPSDMTAIRVREEAMKLGADMPSERATALYDEAISGRLNDAAIQALPANERSYVRAVERLNEQLLARDLADGALAERFIDTPAGNRVREVYLPQTAKRIDRARMQRDRFEVLADTLSELSTGAPGDLPSIQSSLARAADVEMPVANRGWMVRANLARLELAGVDVKAWRARLKRTTKSDDMLRLQRDLAAADPAGFKSLPIVPALPDRTVLASLARIDPMVRSFMDLVDAGAWRKAGQTARTIEKRAAGPVANGVDWQAAQRFTQAQAKIAKAVGYAEMNRFGQLASRSAKQVVRAEQTAIPARWHDVAAREIRSELQARIPQLQAEGKLSPQDAARTAELLALDTLDAPSLPPAVRSTLHTVARQVRGNWQSWADQGLDPMFVPRVAKSRVGLPPQIRTGGYTPAAIKERIYDFGSTVNDLAVAVDARAFDQLSRSVSAEMGKWVVDSFARPLDEIKSGLAPFAQDIVARKPALSANRVLDDLVDRNWREITTDSGTHMVPRDVATVWEAMGPKQIDSAFMRTYDSIMGVFRTALLPLSPRWHLYNMVGGAIMMTADQGFGAWRHLPRAWEFAKNGAQDVRGLPAMGEVTRRVREQAQWSRGLDIKTPKGKALAIWDTAAGKFLARIWDESEAVAKVKRGASAGVERSYAFNEMFDDMYRAMTYLSGEEKALRRGLSRVDAEAAGVGAARRVLANWDRMTPIERSVIRNIFPFYSWSKHLLGYVSRFPFDHPLRTAVTASLVQAELEDFGTGLPQSFFSLIDITGPANFLGLDTEPGERVMVNMDGMNPFRDVASWASLVSFLGSAATGRIDPSADIGAVTSQSSPAIQFLLASVGVDPAEGVPDPYADVTLDPRTGQLRTTNSFNPLTAIPQSIVPQSRAVLDAAGVNRDFQRLYQSNPEAAVRRLWSGSGMPITALPRWVDRPKEIIKAEVRRYEDVSRTESRALRSGDLSILDRYPAALGPTKRRLEEARRRGALTMDEDEINEAVGR